jgi:hypothetical protein
MKSVRFLFPGMGFYYTTDVAPEQAAYNNAEEQYDPHDKRHIT